MQKKFLYIEKIDFFDFYVRIFRKNVVAYKYKKNKNNKFPNTIVI